MHLESPDKRPTEYGQNPKEFVMQEKFMIAACLYSADWTDYTEQIRGILAAIRLIVVPMLKESLSRQSIGVTPALTHCYPSIIEWSRIWGSQVVLTGGSVFPHPQSPGVWPGLSSHDVIRYVIHLSTLCSPLYILCPLQIISQKLNVSPLLWEICV